MYLPHYTVVRTCILVSVSTYYLTIIHGLEPIYEHDMIVSCSFFNSAHSVRETEPTVFAIKAGPP